MRCSSIREALSARLDGEVTGLPDDEVDAHLHGCAECRAWSDGAGALALAVSRAPRDLPALDPALLVALTSGSDESRRAQRITSRWRLALAVIAMAQLVVSWPGVLLRDGHSSVHLAHELTAWDMGLAVGFLVAAVVPARAWGMLPLAAVLVACMAGMSVVDLLSGHALLGRELVHGLSVAGLGAVWVLARRVPRAPVVLSLA